MESILVTTEEKIEKALGNLLKECYTYEIDGCFINVFAQPNRAHNITPIVIESMLKNGFFLHTFTLTERQKPMVVFTRFYQF